MKRFFLVPALAIAALISASPGAFAYAYAYGPATVSCDATITSTLNTVSHVTNGNMYFNQYTSTSPAITSTVWAVSSNGNPLRQQNVANGGSAPWTSVLASTYTFKTHPATSVNCNGPLPGDGNSTLQYVITY